MIDRQACLMRRHGAVLIATCLLLLGPRAMGQPREDFAADDDVAAVQAGQPPALPTPQWIWATGPRDRTQAAVLKTTCTLPKEFASVRVEAIADFADAELRINGVSAGRLEPFQPVAQWDATNRFRPGLNELSLHATAAGGPAAVALRISWYDAQREQHALISDAAWQSENHPVAIFGKVTPVLWDGNRGPVPLSALEDYTQWKRALNPGQVTEPSSFIAPPGFEVQLLHTAKPEEGSWVAMAFDPQGRLTVAKEARGLLRFTLAGDDLQVRLVESIDDELEECRGLVYHDGDLYANANNTKALFRLSDTDGDGSFDRRQQVYAAAGDVGHGRNDVAFGPEGELYSIHGDSVDLPRDFVDRCSPAREHHHGERTREGHLLQLRRDGEGGEIISAGLRNPFGIAFNQDGEAFTYDADAEHDMGAPWYRPTRVQHLFAGADFGWRGVTGDWPPYYPDHPDNAPSVLDVGRGSPTAVKFATGSHFPPPYDQALFILDWAYGRIVSVRMEPRGSSYACLGETFLQGRPLNVTDVEIGPDGAMYLITGGRKTQSALYRVSYQGTAVTPPAPTPQQQARREHAAQQRARRRSLESMLGQRTSAVLETVWDSLADADPWIRYVARTVVEHQPVNSWASRALQENDHSRAVAALMALARCDVRNHGIEIVRKLASLPIDAVAPRDQSALLYTAWLCLQAQPENAAIHAALTASLLPRYPCQATSHEVAWPWNLWASRILVQTAPDQAVPKTMQLLLDTEDQHQQLHYLFVLRGARDGWTDTTRQLFFARLRDAQYFESGAGMPEFLRQIREEAIQTLSSEQQAALAPWLAAAPPPLPAARPRKFLHHWTMQELEALAATQPGDAKPANSSATGQQLFVDAQCAACHRLGPHGRPLGPDLTYAASRYSERDLLQAIVHPSEVVAADYRNVQVLTEDGEVHVGRVLTSGDFRAATVRLIGDLRNPERVLEIEKQTITEYRPSPVSPMPEGLLDVLTADEVLELLRYLRSGAGLVVPQ
ncbi:MAG: DUF7133 domain-containing protein [Planctomycetaceae bacterium]